MNISTKTLLTSLAILQYQVPIYAMDGSEASSEELIVTPRISYFCPKMEVEEKIINILMTLPNNTIVETKGWEDNHEGGFRHTLYTLHSDDEEITHLSLNCNQSYRISVYLVVQYLVRNDNGSIHDHLDPIRLTLEQKNIRPDLEAIRITHSPESIEKMWVAYKYKIN